MENDDMILVRKADILRVMDLWFRAIASNEEGTVNISVEKHERIYWEMKKRFGYYHTTHDGKYIVVWGKDPSDNEGEL